MPASQLKRLKASLREQGVTGAQRSKKQKKAQNGRNANERVQRDAALHQIRESFNPFEYKANARPEKFSTANSNSSGAKGPSGRYKAVLHRPGVTKSAGEEMRRNTLLPELRRRNKVGGLVDRRIGEGDVDMTPEERAVQRFTQERERKRKGAGLFDLEASDDDGGLGNRSKLTHGGRSLDDLEADDFDDDVSRGSEEDEDGDLIRRKRRRPDDGEDDDGVGEAEDVGKVEDGPERKKTKKEVMEELIAKSKYHKYERQKAKEDDEELREELDQGFGEMLDLLRGVKKPAKPAAKPDLPDTDGNGPTMNPDRQKLVDGMDRDRLDRDYDVRLRQLAQDTRAKPSERTKTAEEKAAAEAERLRDMEEKRTKRMRGEEVSEDEGGARAGDQVGDDDDEVVDEAAGFGFASSTAQPKAGKQLVLDEEDDFDLDEELIASGSDTDVSDVDSQEVSDEEGSSDVGEEADHEDEEDEFVRGILGDDVIPSMKPKSAERKVSDQSGLAYTYPCPRSHDELLDVVKGVPNERLITVIQRIRALYHPSLSDSNKESMADFSCSLVDHLSYMGSEKQPLEVIEQVIRHLHSLSRTYPMQIGETFRKHLASLHERGQPHAGDLVILTAIGSIYPTSDHWHQVVTPAITVMARWLGLNAPNPTKPLDSRSSSLGSFLVALCIQYQKLSKRYIPEALRFTLRALSTKATDSPETLTPHITNLTAAAELWKDHSAFTQSFTPAVPLLRQLKAKKALQHLQILLGQSRLRLRPLELHHHRPMAIRTSVPKFEEGFHPDKHYDPDKERSDAKRLQKEYKRERKGALRELRKDSNFIAREQLREKKARDAEYEKKYRRLVAEVQAEEGYEANNYEREKRARMRKR